eukprot:scaffold46293_cov70-Phaeocystis_antarctica.AAC.4
MASFLAGAWDRDRSLGRANRTGGGGVLGAAAPAHRLRDRCVTPQLSEVGSRHAGGASAKALEDFEDFRLNELKVVQLAAALALEQHHGVDHELLCVVFEADLLLLEELAQGEEVVLVLEMVGLLPQQRAEASNAGESAPMPTAQHLAQPLHRRT